MPKPLAGETQRLIKSFTIEMGLHEWLVRTAHIRKCSVSELVNEAVRSLREVLG